MFFLLVIGILILDLVYFISSNALTFGDGGLKNVYTEKTSTKRVITEESINSQKITDVKKSDTSISVIKERKKEDNKKTNIGAGDIKAVSEIKNRINVTWYPIYIGLVDKEYNITIQNLENQQKSVDVGAFFKAVTKDIDTILPGSIQLSYLTDLTKVVDNYSTTCTDKQVVLSQGEPNQTITTIKECTMQNNPTTINYKGWKAYSVNEVRDGAKQEIVLQKTNENGKITLAPNSITSLNLKFKTKIVNREDGSYGNDGEFGLLLDGVSYHPTFNVSFSKRYLVSIVTNDAIDTNYTHNITFAFTGNSSDIGSGTWFRGNQSVLACSFMILIFNGTTELDRDIYQCNTSSFQILFRNQHNLTRSTIYNDLYEIYYDPSGNDPPQPPSDWVDVYVGTSDNFDVGLNVSRWLNETSGSGKSEWLNKSGNGYIEGRGSADPDDGCFRSANCANCGNNVTTPDANEYSTYSTIVMEFLYWRPTWNAEVCNSAWGFNDRPCGGSPNTNANGAFYKDDPPGFCAGVTVRTAEAGSLTSSSTDMTRTVDWQLAIVNITGDTRASFMLNNLSDNNYQTITSSVPNNKAVRALFRLEGGTQRFGIDDVRIFYVLASPPSYAVVQQNFTMAPPVIIGLPTVIRVDINSTDPTTNDTNQNITIYPRNVTDPEGGFVTNITNWFKDGASLTILNLAFDTNTTSGQTIKDYSGNTGNGTPVNITWVPKGINGGAYKFVHASVNQRITFSQTNDLHLNNSFAIEAWFNISTGLISTHQYLIVAKRQQSGPSSGWKLGVENGGGMILLFTQRRNSIDVTLEGSGFLQNKWNHVVINFDGSMISMWINGILRKNATMLGNLNGNDINNFNITIGNYNIENGVFEGIIDTVRIYNRSLSEEQIRLLNSSNGEDWLTIVSQETTAAENWSACVTPNDGTQDGIEVCSENISILNLQPEVTLNNPPNGTSNISVSHVFNANMSNDLNLLNATLYHNISGSWQANQTLTISGITNSTNFSVANILPGIYEWNVQVCDIHNLCKQAPQNFTFTVTSFPPQVSLNTPVNSSINSSISYVFNANMSNDLNLVNATLFHDATGVWQANQTAIISGTANETNFSVSGFSQGIFTWNVEVCDIGNICSQAISNFTFAVMVINLSLICPVVPFAPATEFRSIGFWKNHPNNWSTTQLVIGNQTLNQSQALDILNNARARDMTYQLAAQLIAAKLNVAAGATNLVASTITAADNFLVSSPIGSDPSGDQRQTAEALKDTLDAYNNGKITS